jgi:hypothetical protein
MVCGVAPINYQVAYIWPVWYNLSREERRRKDWWWLRNFFKDGSMQHEHKEEQSRYTIGFFLLVAILVASVLAVTVKVLIVWIGQ